jgi:lysylphosphatidylglycerol synthetase-like protein (DUF2156 family)
MQMADINMQQQKQRPLGVTIISILTILGGIGFLATGIVPLVATPFLSDSNVSPAVLVGLSSGIGIALIILGLAYFVMAYGLWKGKGWAWSITVVLSFVGIVLGVVSIATGNVAAIFHIIINAVVLYYLCRTHVKMFFGKTTEQAAMTT